jgi:hypothetical protein
MSPTTMGGTRLSRRPTVHRGYQPWTVLPGCKVRTGDCLVVSRESRLGRFLLRTSPAALAVLRV